MDPLLAALVEHSTVLALAALTTFAAFEIHHRRPKRRNGYRVAIVLVIAIMAVLPFPFWAMVDLWAQPRGRYVLLSLFAAGPTVGTLWWESLRGRPESLLAALGGRATWPAKVAVPAAFLCTTEIALVSHYLTAR